MDFRVERTWRSSLLAPASLVAATILVYANSFDGQFIFDDMPNIVENEQIRVFPPRFATLTGHLERSLTNTTLAANWRFGQNAVAGYHAVNLTIHILAGLLLFNLLRRTLRCEPPDSTWHRSARGLAWAIALLWLVHPLQTQSVTYIIQRAEALTGLFTLAMLNALLHGAEASRRMGRFVGFAGATIACALGMCSKEVMVTAPILAIVFDRIFLATSWRDLVRRRWLVHLSLLSCLLLTMRSVATLTTSAPSDEPLQAVGFHIVGVSPWEFLRNQPGVLLHYLRLVVRPVGQCLDYDWPVAHGFADIVLPGSIIVGLLMATAVALWRWPKLGFCGAAFFIILAPSSSFIPLADLAFEHRMYLALAPILTLLVLGGHALSLRIGARRNVDLAAVHRWELGATLLLATSFGVMTVARNFDYHDVAGMWTLVLQNSPHNIRARNNLGQACLLNGQYDAAFREFAAVLRMRDYPDSLAGMADVLEKFGNTSQAVEHYNAALRGNPSRAAHYEFRIGSILAGAEKWQDALPHFREANRRRPQQPIYMLSLALVLSELGQAAEAERIFAEIVALDPDFAGMQIPRRGGP